MSFPAILEHQTIRYDGITSWSFELEVGGVLVETLQLQQIITFASNLILR